MANFQRSIIVVAIILLIISLILIGVSLSKSTTSQTWPPIVGECPDYWVDLSGNGSKCENVKSLGTCDKTEMDFTTPAFTGSNELCAKYTWATNCGLTWDGITSGVTNPCDTTATSSTTTCSS